MNQYSSDIAFTPAVKALQAANGSRASYAKMEQNGGWETSITPVLKAFLARMDMFYLGTANAEGHPYIQYRGGPPGFLKVIDETTLGFADFGGNQQFITTGNLSENPKAFIFLMDYVNGHRLKLWGRAKVIQDDSELLNRLSDPDYNAQVQRAVLFELDTWCGNCSQHIHRRFPEQEVAHAVAELQGRIEQLTAELAVLKAKSS